MASLAKKPDHTAVCTQEGGELVSDLDQADDRQIAGICMEADACLSHPVSPDSLHREVGSPPQEFLNHVGSMKVS
jgi:hypothetical protein